MISARVGSLGSIPGNLPVLAHAHRAMPTVVFPDPPRPPSMQYPLSGIYGGHRYVRGSGLSSANVVTSGGLTTTKASVFAEQSRVTVAPLPLALALALASLGLTTFVRQCGWFGCGTHPSLSIAASLHKIVKVTPRFFCCYANNFCARRRPSPGKRRECFLSGFVVVSRDGDALDRA